MKKHWKMIGRYENGEEIIVFGNDDADCAAKLAGYEKQYGALLYSADVSDDQYDRGRYIGKEAADELHRLCKLLDEYMFVVSLKKRMEDQIFDRVKDFGGYDDPEKMALIIPHVQQSYVRLKLFNAYWNMTSSPTQPDAASEQKPEEHQEE